ncbi:MAG: uroporphyrinogen decarboxylase family protein [Bryobacteraceae bacterium]
MSSRQAFEFGFTDPVIAELAGVPQRDLHFDVDAIIRGYQLAGELAVELGVPAPLPRLAEFTYTHIVALGTQVTFTEYEPKPTTLLTSPVDIDNLCEPEDYLAASLIQERLKLAEELVRRWPGAPLFIGHLFEGPVTTASLLLGPAFFTLPYDDPSRTHKLMQFSVTSAFGYARAITRRFSGVESAFPQGFPDDFAGIIPPKLFGEFVVPYWEQIFEQLNSTERFVHSELLRVGHLPFLKDLRVDCYDPSADQYLTPGLLKQHCPTRFQLRIQDWDIANQSATELQQMYRRYSTYNPKVISFYLSRLVDVPKVKAVLEVALEQ